MSDKVSELAGIVTDAMKSTVEKKTEEYDTIATVTRIDEDGTPWVSIPGGVVETPIRQSISVSPGDEVQVHVGGGRAWMQGNYTSPPTDDKRANQAYEVAYSAISSASVAKNAADRATESADKASTEAARAESKANAASSAAAAASTAAERANDILDDMSDAAEAAGTTLEGIYQDAEDAKMSATNASEYAARALGNLSTVQNITETLNWITAHGTMTLTSDTSLDPSHVYFVRDNNGDYTVGGNKYSVVSEPDVSDISTYYELSIDESLNNYVATHLAVDSEGLWIIPEAQGNRVLIAVGGTNHLYSSPGTYIIDSDGATVAKFLSDKAVIGDEDGYNYMTVDKSGFGVTVDAGRSEIISGHVINLDPTRDITYNTEHMFQYPPIHSYYTIHYPEELVLGSELKFDIYLQSPYPDGSTYNQEFSFTAGTSGTVIAFEYRPQETEVYYLEFAYDGGYYVTITSYYTWSVLMTYASSYTYTVNQDRSAYFTFGDRKETSNFGKYSVAEGYDVSAKGDYSHAQNLGTIASSKYQTALGKYNLQDNLNKYAVIVGNGEYDPTAVGEGRSNVATLDWDGKLTIGGTVLSEYDGTNGITLSKDVWYGTCSTSADTARKVVTTGAKFSLKEGRIIYVKFTYTNTSNSISFKIGDTIPTFLNWSGGMAGAWKAGETVPFIYDGTYLKTLFRKPIDTYVSDVEVNGSSVVSSGVADVTVPTATSDLTNDSGFISEDANGDISITRNITAGGNVEAAGDVTDGAGNVLSSIAAHAVISTGSTGGWNYKKYADGTFEATRFSDSGATGAMTQVGSTGIYYSSAAEITFPSIGITAIRSCTASVMPNSNYLMSYYMSRLTTAHVYFSYIRYGSGAAVTNISYGISITGTYS